MATDVRALERVEEQLGSAGLLGTGRVQVVLRDQVSYELVEGQGI